MFCPGVGSTIIDHIGVNSPTAATFAMDFFLAPTGLAFLLESLDIHRLLMRFTRPLGLFAFIRCWSVLGFIATSVFDDDQIEHPCSRFNTRDTDDELIADGDDSARSLGDELTGIAIKTPQFTMTGLTTTGQVNRADESVDKVFVDLHEHAGVGHAGDSTFEVFTKMFCKELENQEVPQLSLSSFGVSLGS